MCSINVPPSIDWSRSLYFSLSCQLAWMHLKEFYRSRFNIYYNFLVVLSFRRTHVWWIWHIFTCLCAAPFCKHSPKSSGLPCRKASSQGGSCASFCNFPTTFILFMGKYLKFRKLNYYYMRVLSDSGFGMWSRATEITMPDMTFMSWNQVQVNMVTNRGVMKQPRARRYLMIAQIVWMIVWQDLLYMKLGIWEVQLIDWRFGEISFFCLFFALFLFLSDFT